MIETFSFSFAGSRNFFRERSLLIFSVFLYIYRDVFLVGVLFLFPCSNEVRFEAELFCNGAGPLADAVAVVGSWLLLLLLFLFNIDD